MGRQESDLQKDPQRSQMIIYMFKVPNLPYLSKIIPGQFFLILSDDDHYIRSLYLVKDKIEVFTISSHFLKTYCC